MWCSSPRTSCRRTSVACSLLEKGIHYSTTDLVWLGVSGIMLVYLSEKVILAQPRTGKMSLIWSNFIKIPWCVGCLLPRLVQDTLPGRAVRPRQFYIFGNVCNVLKVGWFDNKASSSIQRKSAKCAWLLTAAPKRYTSARLHSSGKYEDVEASVWNRSGVDFALCNLKR